MVCAGLHTPELGVFTYMWWWGCPGTTRLPSVPAPQQTLAQYLHTLCTPQDPMQFLASALLNPPSTSCQLARTVQTSLHQAAVAQVLVDCSLQLEHFTHSLQCMAMGWLHPSILHCIACMGVDPPAMDRQLQWPLSCTVGAFAGWALSAKRNIPEVTALPRPRWPCDC